MGYDLGYISRQGQSPEIYLSLYWSAIKPVSEDYTVFVHLRDADNNTVVDGDHQPYDGLVPTRLFPVDKVVKDTVRIDVPPDLLAGGLRVVCGLRSVDTLERLPLMDDTSGAHALEPGHSGAPIPAVSLAASRGGPSLCREGSCFRSSGIGMHQQVTCGYIAAAMPLQTGEIERLE